MNQQILQASDLVYLAPELTVLIFAFLLAVIDLLAPKGVRRDFIGWLAFIGLVISAIFTFGQLNIGEPVQLLNQSYRIDDFAALFKLIFLGSAALIILMSLGDRKAEDIPHVGEFYYFFLPATLGAMIMASSGDMITLYVGLEVLSITTYIMVGMRKFNILSNEAAFKYLVLGGISSAMFLYGVSFLYGMTGTTNMAEMATALNMQVASFPLLIYVALFLILAGLAFKIAAVPFHVWAPDVYQGAPMPVTAYLAVVSKAAGFAVLFRMVYNVFYGVGDPLMAPIHTDLFLALVILAGLSMIIGNAAALRQKNMKRLLALSGVANAGYLLVPLAIQFSIVHYANVTEFLFYMIAYAFMNIGAFAVLAAVSRSSGHEELKGFAGLYYRAPWTAVAMVILIMSLAGLPPTGGFFGKLYILLGTLQTQHYILALIMMITSTISFYYYFGIIRQMFMRTGGETGEMAITFPVALTVWISVIATVILGLVPHWVIGAIEEIFSIPADLFIQ